MTSVSAPPPPTQRMDSQPLYQPAGEAELRQALTAATWESLPPVSLGLGVGLGVYALGLAFFHGRYALALGLAAGVSGAILLGLYIAFRRRLLHAHWTRPLADGLAGLTLLNGLLPMFLGPHPEYIIFLTLAAAGAGYFLLYPRELAVFIGAALLGWLAAALLAGFSSTWIFYGAALLASALLAVVIHRSRVHLYRQMEGLRLQNLRRKAELQRVLRATDEAQRSLATSMAVGQRIVSILDLDALLDQVTSLIQERFRCYYVGIFLVDESDENYVTARAGAGQVGHTLVELGFRLKFGEREASTNSEASTPEGVIGWVAAHRRPACVADILKDERYYRHDLLPDTRSELALPLEMGNQLLGVLDMESIRPGAFHENDVSFMQLLADQAATALHNARLYQQLNRFNQDLEKLVQQRTQALEAMDRAKSDFISVTSHELRTPLTLLRGYGQMLADEAAVKQSSALNTMVNGILAGSDRLHAIVDSMLDVAKIDNQVLDLNPTPFSLKALLRLVCEELRTGMVERHLTVEEDLQDIPHIEADLDSVRKLFTQLVSNAVKYTPDGGKITLSGKQLPPGEVLAEACVEVVVSDTGIGIDPQLQELIFTKFYRTGSVATYSSSKTRFKGGGPGLGLSIAKGIVEAHGGLIWAESPGYDEELCPGSKFHVILPLRYTLKE